ncbi:MAG: class I adenylate-forming enzyme family protein [Acidimicrobiales bacterium]
MSTENLGDTENSENTDFGNLGGVFSRWVGTGRTAFLDVTHGDITAPVEVGFDEFDDRCGRVAAGLLALGLKRGDRVGIAAENSVHYAACYFGIVRAGLVTVPLNVRQPAETLAWVADDADLAAVLHDEANRALVPEGVTAIEFDSPQWSSFVDLDPAPVTEMSSDEVAIQMYTSGSTGRPKGVVLTHGGQLFSIGLYLSGVMPLDPGERLLISAPMYHKNAAMQLKMALSLGGSVVLLRRFDAADYLLAIDLHRVTAMTGVPTMFALMFARADLLDTLDRSSVRRLSIGSAPMTQALFDQARELFPDSVITNGYGTTEVVAVFGGHPDGLPRPDISVGYPLSEVESRLVDPATGSDAVADPTTGHRQGELWVRSAGVMAGYHQLPDVTAARLTDGWYHTGDVMEADVDGWHFFVGRVDDMFSCAGENVYPGDVEQMLERCPVVQQAAVVPVADELKGALPVAFVVLAAGHDPDEQLIKTWALENGPAYQHPRAVWFVDEIPLASTAKIDKATLATEAEQRWVPRA